MKTHTLKPLLKKYLNELEELERSKITIKNYNANIHYFINYLIDNNIKEINKDNICDILKQYNSYLRNIKQNTASTRITYVQHVFYFLDYIGLKIDNIHKKKLLPKNTSKNKKIKYLTIEEIKEVQNSIPKTMVRDTAVFQMLYRTGLRVSELANLTKNDLNLNSKDKAVPVNVIDGKGGKDRTVYIDQDTLKLLNTMIYKRTRKNKPDETDYLFTARTGNKLSERSIQDIIKKYAIITDKKNKKNSIKTEYVEKLTPHTLRHSFTIYLINEVEKPINEVQKLLGHSNLATTSIYLDVDSKHIKKSYETIEWN